MKHWHSETVAYDDRSYSRTYTHDHKRREEAHLHPHAWEAKTKDIGFQGFVMAGSVPVMQTVRMVVKVEV